MPTDTHALRAFAVYLAGDGYTDEHVRMIEGAADEIERLRTRQVFVNDGFRTFALSDNDTEWVDVTTVAKAEG